MEIALVYMVAGMSSRFGGKIKQLAKVGPNNETLIEYSLNQALKAGFTKIVFIVGNKTEQPFKEMFGDDYQGIPVYYAKQEFNPKERDKPWGTVDSLCSARKVIDCSFVVCNGDDIYGQEVFRLLTEHINNKKDCATIGYKLGDVLYDKGSVNRGIFQIKDNKKSQSQQTEEYFLNLKLGTTNCTRVQGITPSLSNKVLSLREELGITKDNLKEKMLSENDFCSMNIFALNPKVITQLDKILTKFKEENKDNRTIECLLPKELNELIKNNELILEIYPTKEKWIGITNPEDEEIVRNELKIKTK
ncbi:MAG: sugar phosphate nucleotidyltransferase [Nanoarchaeota archaeon]|nr:sugar phosphate nucleotidyltransferase [Nanoarchaeota archaeon]